MIIVMPGCKKELLVIPEEHIKMCPQCKAYYKGYDGADPDYSWSQELWDAYNQGFFDASMDQ